MDMNTDSFRAPLQKKYLQHLHLIAPVKPQHIVSMTIEIGTL